MHIKTLKGKYFCEIIEDAKQLPSGLFIAESTKEVPHRAKVLEAGGNGSDGKGRTVKQSAKKGDVVHFKRVWNRELPKNRDLIFIKEDEIVGIEGSV